MVPLMKDLANLYLTFVAIAKRSTGRTMDFRITDAMVLTANGILGSTNIMMNVMRIKVCHTCKKGVAVLTKDHLNLCI